VAVDERIVGFTTALRAAGIDVPVGATITFAEALVETGIERESSVYWAGRATLVTEPEQRSVYDEVFASFWRRSRDAMPLALPAEVTEVALPEGDDSSSASDLSEDEGPRVVIARASRTEVLRHKDFAACSADELAETQRLIDDLRVRRERRRSRRLRRDRHHGHLRGARFDVRTTVRRSLRAGGEPAVLARRRPSTRARRLVLLVDVSGSMDPYARSLLRFAHAGVRAGGVETFAIGTRLTRLTNALTSRDPDAAMARATAAVEDWSGGTRLGDGLRAFNDQWGVRGMARGATVVILSDGWERGDPSLVAEQMARLHRVAHRVVWVNPLKATEGYAPIAQGMAAALPFVDEFVPGHSLSALETLARLLGGEA
jgi:uncharacterized protein with von Willebrand factor type A (vWA) domain